jgi:hypothetical protein
LARHSSIKNLIFSDLPTYTLLFDCKTKQKDRLMITKDIIDRVTSDFGDADERELAFALLADLEEMGLRVIRCVVHMAHGDLDELEGAEKLARIDLRALYLCAEYDEKAEKKLHDYNKRFKRELTSEEKCNVQLREAMKAFRKRLKLYRLDEESRIGGSKVTKGESSGIVAIQAPNSFPREVWDKLVELGELREKDDNYELVE